FRVIYNLRNKNLMLTQLMKKLQSYMLNGCQSVRKIEANLAINFSSKWKVIKLKEKKLVERKRTNKPKDLSNSKCFFCNKKWHFKAKYKEWKDYLATKGKGNTQSSIVTIPEPTPNTIVANN
ncbi:hypothetical protein J1N35_040646, partial [Gossypium stocksii]